MRTSFFLAAVFAIAACSRDDQPMSPAGQSTPPSTATASLALAEASKAPPAGARPADLVGFTKVEMVYGTLTDMPAGVFNSAYAFCPQGSSAVGGGFHPSGITGTAPHLSSIGRPLVGSETGWGVTFDNRAAGSAPFKLQVWVTCVS